MVCRNAEMNKAGTYPRSCPVCKFSGVCSQGVERDPSSPIEAKYYIPTKKHEVSTDKYAVIYTDTISHAADQRSIDCPGHGYPAWTESIEKIQTFKSEGDLKEWILSNNSGYSRKTFKAIKYQELKVQTDVSISLG